MPPAANGSSGKESNNSHHEEVTTIFVVGFPDDITDREFQNMFMFAPGFEGATLKIPQSLLNDPESHHQSEGNGNKKQIIGFAKFKTRSEALHAKDLLNGRRIDPEKYTVLKAEIAKKNLHKKRGSFANDNLSNASLPELKSSHSTLAENSSQTSQQDSPQDHETMIDPDDVANNILQSSSMTATATLKNVNSTMNNNGSQAHPAHLQGSGMISQIVSSGMLSRPSTPAGLLNLQPLLPALNADADTSKKDDTLYIHSPPPIPRDLLTATDMDPVESYAEKVGLSRSSSTHSLNDFIMNKFSQRQTEFMDKLQLTRTASGSFGHSLFDPTFPYASEFSSPFPSGIDRHHPHVKPFNLPSPGFPSILDPLAPSSSRFDLNTSAAHNMNSSASNNMNTSNLNNHTNHLSFSSVTSSGTIASANSASTATTTSSSSVDATNSIPLTSSAAVTGMILSNQHASQGMMGMMKHNNFEKLSTPTLSDPVNPTSNPNMNTNGNNFNPSSGGNAINLDNIPLSHPAHRGTADQNPPCNTLYVGNLPPDTYPEELEALFSTCKGYKRLCFRNRLSGPMCFVEFEDIPCAAQAMQELYGVPLSTHTKGGIRLSFSKNPLGVRPNSNSNNTNTFNNNSLSTNSNNSSAKGPNQMIRTNSTGSFLSDFPAESIYDTPRSSPTPSELTASNQQLNLTHQYHPMHSQHQQHFQNVLAYGANQSASNRSLSASSSPLSLIPGMPPSSSNSQGMIHMN